MKKQKHNCFLNQPIHTGAGANPQTWITQHSFINKTNHYFYDSLADARKHRHHNILTIISVVCSCLIIIVYKEEYFQIKGLIKWSCIFPLVWKHVGMGEEENSQREVSSQKGEK